MKEVWKRYRETWQRFQFCYMREARSWRTRNALTECRLKGVSISASRHVPSVADISAEA